MSEVLSALKIMPAIDLIEGKVVRLKQGSFAEVVRYPVEALAIAKTFEQAGARYLHIVDLDGARAQRPMQRETIQEITRETRLRVQVGGGIRQLQQVEEYLRAGAERVVIGSLAVQDIDLTRTIIETVGADRITLAFDFQRDENGEIWPAVHAWASLNKTPPEALFAAYQAYAELEFLCTDISRDGCLTGVDPAFYRELLQASQGAKIIVSGGVSSLDDLRLTRELLLHGVVIGKALHEGRFKLEDALLC